LYYQDLKFVSAAGVKDEPLSRRCDSSVFEILQSLACRFIFDGGGEYTSQLA